MTDDEQNGWEIVRTVGTDEEANLVAGFLESSEIPAEVQSLLFHQEPVTFGRLGEVRVLVPVERLEEARRLLDERDAAAPAEEADATPAPSPPNSDGEAER